MMYSFKANVFNTKLGSAFGKTTTITIVANNKEDAYKEAEKSFNKYIHSLNIHYNIDGNGKVRKTINKFAYNNLTFKNMIIETKYNIGDKVWIMNNNKPEQVSIVKLVIDVYISICEQREITNISYYTDNNEIYAAENIYSTKDELKEAVFN